MIDVILVNESDQEVGRCEKMLAHEEGLLHRAFSIFLFNAEGEMLLHRRALGKYHSGGLWTNACCSHPMPGVAIEYTLQEKLQQEMGIQCPLQFAFSFLYKAQLDNNLIEHELDHVYIGQFNGAPQPNPEEVADWRYFSISEISNLMISQPQMFTEWFKIAFQQVIESIENKYQWAS
jgi:isopentenyl-diphosphate delta-isomerase